MSGADGRVEVSTSHLGVVDGIESCLRIAGDPASAAGSNPDASAWSVAGHLEHVMLADHGILAWISSVLAETGPIHHENIIRDILR